MPPPATPASRAAEPDESESRFAVGAIANLNDLLSLAAPLPSKPSRPETAPFESLEPELLVAPGAVAGVLALLDAGLGPVASPPPATHVLTEAEGAEEPALAFGAVPGCMAMAPDLPSPSVFVAPQVVDLDEVALDDLLADACEALYVAALDPTELYAWGVSALPDDESATHGLLLCASESALWGLPPDTPLNHPLHLNLHDEFAVNITRALRIHADTPRARGFTAGAAFGAIQIRGALDCWFPVVDVDTFASESIDADKQFAAWDDSPEACAVTTAARPAPILSEAELDALLSTPAAVDSHELEDDWQDNPVWQETFWHNVDAYLQSVEPGDGEAHHECDLDAELHALAVREHAPTSTHFWFPGDDADLAIAGDGDDLFLIGGGEAGVVLVEDGVMHAMRTGAPARAGEIVISWSPDTRSDIHSDSWTRVATLSGVNRLRVEQTASHDRIVIVAGDLVGCDLSPADVRLVEATETGPVDFPVLRLGIFGGVGDDWPFDGLQVAEAGSGRLFV
jgi:hypothetical protein